MIDLTKKALPEEIIIDGVPFAIYTDHRTWLRLLIAIDKMQKGDTLDVSFLFKNEMPSHCSIETLLKFGIPKPPLPRSLDSSDVIVLDYEIDADLIYAAFLGQYGIDLCAQDLHIHQFMALIRGLNSNTKLYEVMGYRCYKKSNEKEVDQYERLRWAWEIERQTPEDEEAIKQFSDLFY